MRPCPFCFHTLSLRRPPFSPRYNLTHALSHVVQALDTVQRSATTKPAKTSRKAQRGHRAIIYPLTIEEESLASSAQRQRGGSRARRDGTGGAARAASFTAPAARARRRRGAQRWRPPVTMRQPLIADIQRAAEARPAGRQMGGGACRAPAAPPLPLPQHGPRAVPCTRAPPTLPPPPIPARCSPSCSTRCGATGRCGSSCWASTRPARRPSCTSCT